MLAKIRRMRYRDGLSLRDISRRTGLSRNTIRHWLRYREMVEPAYPPRNSPSVVDPWADKLADWLKTDRHRPRRDRRTARMLYQAIQGEGYSGSYGRVCVFVRRFKAEASQFPSGRQAFVPLHFAPGEAFQFDWSTEFATVGGTRRRLEVAQLKLASSRAFWLVAYFTQSHEMLFDAHTQAFAALGGVPRRGIYDNMKTAVDKVGPSRQRAVNARFEAMCGHYLFEPEFCNLAAAWEKGRVEKNVQDRRRQIWREIAGRNWNTMAELNAHMAVRCREAWDELQHPDDPTRTVAEVWREERPQLMPNPRPFDGYVEHPARVTATALVHCLRNRYSVPSEYAHKVVSLRLYPTEVVAVADGMEVARHPRSLERDQTIYDFCHYIGLLQRKPGALRNGAPFLHMPEPLIRLQRHLRRHPNGDRVMVQVLSTIPIPGVELVVEAVQRALESGFTSGEHVLNLISRLGSPSPDALDATAGPPLREVPIANVTRYDALRLPAIAEVNHD
jgi:transposase